MATLKDIIDNELIKEILEIRIDSLWRLLSLRGTAHYPSPSEEGASGFFDNKGAIFIPGYLIYEDSDRRNINHTNNELFSSKTFRENIRNSMQHDNATLIFDDNIIPGVNLNNGFFAKVASDIIESKEAVKKRSRRLPERSPKFIDSDQITDSHTPNYINRPYGSRTKLSSCISVCISEPRIYYNIGKEIYGLRNGLEQEFWSGLRKHTKPIIDSDGKILAPPYLIACHNTRYKEEIIGGITKVLGIGKFGEFATITIENATNTLLNEFMGHRTNYHKDEIVASYDGINTAIVIRIYHPTNPGKRSTKFNSYLLSLERDLNIDKNKIERAARERYQIK